MANPLSSVFDQLRAGARAVDEYVCSALGRLLDGLDVLSPSLRGRPVVILCMLGDALKANSDAGRTRPINLHSYRPRDERGIYSEITAGVHHRGPPLPVDKLPPALGRLMSAIGFMIESILGQLDASVGDDTLNATTRIKTGDRIRIDGAKGEVKLMSSSSSSPLGRRHSRWLTEIAPIQ
jgi:hypothetical protein